MASDDIQQGQFIRLSENNWNVWKFQVKVTLIAKGLYDITTGTKVKPEETDAGYANFIIKDAKAQEILVSRMESGPISNIISCNSAKEMWDKLHIIYERKSNVSIHLLQQQFFCLKFEDNIMNFISKVQNMVAEMKQLNEEIPEKMVITKIIMALPEQYKHFTSAWESVADNQRTLSNLIARLLVEEERLKTKEETVALTAKNQSNIRCFSCSKLGHKKNQCRSFNSVPKNKNVICNFCNKRGHISKFCYFRKNKEAKTNSSENEKRFALIGIENSELDMEFYLDSGASEHMCRDINLFGKYVKLKEPKQIKIGDGTLITAVGIGTIYTESYNGKSFIKVELQNVLHVPDLKINLFSQGKALDKGLYMTSDSQNAKFINQESGKVCAVAKREGKLFRMLFRLDKNIMFTEENLKKHEDKDKCCIADGGLRNKKKTLMWWHERLAHQNFEHVKKLLNEHEISWENSGDIPFCEACIQGKQHRSPFHESKSKSTEVCNIIHADLCGPIEVSSIGKSRYMLLLKDDYSHFRQVYFLENKYQVYDKLSEFILMCEKQMNKNIKILRSDLGKEFVNDKVKQLLINHGIEHQTSVAYCHQQNGKIEREMRTVMEAARSMLVAKNLDKKFWAEAANTAVYIINRTGTSTVKGKTPFELWKNKPFDIKNLKFTFGSEVWVHIPKEKRKKLDAKSEKGIFVGYGESTKGFRVYFSKSNSVTLHRDLICNPNENILDSTKSEHFVLDYLNPVQQQTSEPEKDEDSNTNNLEENQSSVSEDDDNDHTDTPDLQLSSDKIFLRSRDKIKKPSKYNDYETSFISVTDVEEPTTYEEAMKSNSSKKWQQAIDAELKTLAENDTWDIVDEPNDCDIIDSKWVFKIKRNNTGKISLFKCRLVARGYQQKNLMFEDIYSPVAKLNTLRILLAISVNFDWIVYQMDVCSAFLHGEIKENVFMYLPKNCNLPNGKVCKLKKAIYGLKKSPKYWYEKFHSFMCNQNFLRSDNDHCLYFKLSDTYKIYVLIYVDDLIITGSNVKQINDLKCEMKNNFKMKDLGPISYYLGISVVQNVNESIITLDQSNYLENVLKRFDMFDCKTISTPMDSNFDYESLINEKSENDVLENKCRKIIGCIMYAMLGSRPDLCNSISILSRYQNYASDKLLLFLKRVLRYIKGTYNLKLVYRKNVNSEFVRGFVDADWGGDVINRKSTTGYCFEIYNCTVSWCSKQQTCIALSSTEAEYIALSQCVSEACWFHNLLDEIKVSNDNSFAIPLYEDNQSAIRISKSCEQPKRLKHINVKYHFVQEKVRDGTVQVIYIPSSEQIADLLTKPLGKVLFEKFRELMLG